MHTLPSSSLPTPFSPSDTIAEVASSNLEVLSGGTIESITHSVSPDLAEIGRRYGQYDDYWGAIRRTESGDLILAGSKNSYGYLIELVKTGVLNECGFTMLM